MMPPAALLDDVSPLDLADLLLGVFGRTSAAALIVEPQDNEHVATLLAATGASDLCRLPNPLGDALVVRLAILAGLDPWAVERRIGQLKVRTPSGDADLMVLLRPTARGFGAELRRVAPWALMDATLDLGELAPLQQRIGPYRIRGELGRGGMGVVYRAEHEALRKPVAIKVLHPHLASDHELQVQFISEGRAASLANHAGIVNVTDFGELADGRAFLVMELVEAGTLEGVLAGGPLEPRRAVKIARQIAAALAAAHVRGVVHRDLKPANVFLDGQDHVKVGDFGAAQLLASGPGADVDPRLASVVGTPLYMAPEHARGLETDERTDIYALGCVLFRMLAGRTPFDGATLSDIVLQHVAAEIPEVSSPFRPLPPVLTGLVTQALAKRPEHRHQSMGELSADLDLALAALNEARPGA